MSVDHEFSMTLNGEAVRVAGVSPTSTLLEFLRRRGLSGAKEGCGDGDCGACTVAMLGRGPDGRPGYQAVNACLIMLGSVAGRALITVEGLSPRLGTLHPVQEAMVRTGGSQCGYCTPGFVMSMFVAYYNGGVTDAALEGNLCRCTGYSAIRRAAALLEGPREDDPFLKPLERVPELKPLAYEVNGQHFFRPTTLEGAIKHLRDFPTAKLMAGATDLGLDIARRHRHFPVIVSLEAVSELKGLEEAEDHVELGAGLTLSELMVRFRGRLPALDEMLHLFAGRQIRNRATIGGNLGTASPIGDLAPVFLAHDAEVRLLGAEGERLVPIADFFTGYRQTVLAPGELIASVRLPMTLAPGAVRGLNRSYKVSKRPADDISTVAATFALDLDENDEVVKARLAYGGVAATPARASAVEQALVGKPWSGETVQGVRRLLEASFTPLSDVRGSAGYRRRLVVNLFDKFLLETSPPETNRGR
ncbi:MAG: xanthine dehydrogenase small subunit [Deinococcota bacterium]|jgi:xanthine dehydrogenase small subunit|nr:xanthine dehydrogenase small subunit [Deinococcota bacterium]